MQGNWRTRGRYLWWMEDVVKEYYLDNINTYANYKKLKEGGEI